MNMNDRISFSGMSALEINLARLVVPPPRRRCTNCIYHENPIYNWVGREEDKYNESTPRLTNHSPTLVNKICRDLRLRNCGAFSPHSHMVCIPVATLQLVCTHPPRRRRPYIRITREPRIENPVSWVSLGLQRTVDQAAYSPAPFHGEIPREIKIREIKILARISFTRRRMMYSKYRAISTEDSKLPISRMDIRDSHPGEILVDTRNPG
ncbi:hypothetical protein H4582DRAFT_1184104 [Lactarius indigo]|nr:hypothetical protein H4582DRAFT_1184104 [Lactarius indigo]